jgi:ABC-type multidrug transport system fused ATPase/permease subunit
MQFKWLILADFLMLFMIVLFSAFLPYANKMLFESIAKEAEYPLFQIVSLYAVCIVGIIVCGNLSMIFGWKYGIALELTLKKSFFYSLLARSFSIFKKRETGEYISIQSNDLQAIEMDLIPPLLNMIISLLSLIVYGVVLFVLIDWRVGLTLFLTSVICTLLASRNSEKLAVKRAAHLDSLAKYTNIIKDLLNGRRSVTSRSIDSFVRVHNNSVTETSEKRYAYGKEKTFSITFSGTFTYLINIISFGFIGYLLYKGEIGVGVGVASITYIECFVEPLRQIMYDLAAIRSVKDVANKVVAELETPVAKEMALVTGLNSSIDFRHVEVKYDNFTMRDFTYSFEKGKKYTIIGHNGSGKTRVLELIMKFEIPASGKICVDNQDLSGLDISRIAHYISQSEHMFMADFYNNVTLFGTFGNNGGIKEVLRILYEKYPKVNELLTPQIIESADCSLLSGGEKQLIGLLRAVLSDADVILMDEPLSAVDEATVVRLEDDLMSLFADKTVIVVTHRLTDYLYKFDDILLMENGRMAEHGAFGAIRETTAFNALLNQIENQSKEEGEDNIS